MWILLLLITFWSVVAFLTNHQRQSLLIIAFLTTGGFQLLPIWWFWSPLVLVKPYDYAFVAMSLIFLLRAGDLAKVIATHRMAALATGYMGFLLLVLLASVTVFSFPAVQSIQAARVFFWPAFLLLFLLAERNALERFVSTLSLIVIVLSILYLLQPITGKTIINPSGEFYNPYVGSTDIKRYLSTPDFLIFFLLLAFHRLCTYCGKSLGVRIWNCLGFVLLASVQIVSFTRSALIAMGLALAYLSKRLVNPVLLIMFLASVAAAVAVAYSTSSVVEQRVDESLKDISTTLEGSYLNFHAGTDGNLSYRIAHFNERLIYVAEDVTRWPVGLGFIHEDSAAAQNLGFRTGPINLLTGRPVQVDTGDIAWSLVVIKTGLVGLVLLSIFLIASYIAAGRSDERYAIVYRGGLLYFFVTSFFSTNFVTPNFMMPLMLFLALALRLKEHSAQGVSALHVNPIPPISTRTPYRESINPKPLREAMARSKP